MQQLRQFQLKNGTQIYKNLQTLQRYVLRILQHFASKLGNPTIFRILFLAAVKNFILLPKNEC